MAHSVLIPEAIAATNVDSYNRSVVVSADIDNGNILVMGAKSSTSGESEVFSVSQPASALTHLWMAYSGDEIVLTDARYKGLDPDPRNFFNASGKVFSAFKPQIGDIILITADGLTGTKSTNQYVIAASGTYKLTWASGAISGLSFKLLSDQKYISLATGAIDTQRVRAYEFECVAIA